MIHVCESCDMQWLDDGADQIMDEAFQRVPQAALAARVQICRDSRPLL